MKYRDASGRQVKERLGPAGEGWTKRKAEAALRHRLTDVEREGYRKPDPMTFREFATEWLATYPDAKSLKRSTREGYKLIVERRLIPELSVLRLDTIDVQRIERYIATASRSASIARRSWPLDAAASSASASTAGGGLA